MGESGRVEVRLEPVADGASVLRIEAERPAFAVRDIEQALLSACRQAWPDLTEAAGPRRRELEAAIATDAPLPTHTGWLPVLADALGGPQLVVELTSAHLDAAAADASSRALEALAAEIRGHVVWVVPPEALALPGVVRLGPPALLLEPPITPTELGPPALAPRVSIFGRPHPASPGERSLAAAIRSSPDLAGRFGYNEIVECAGEKFLVDLVRKDAGLIVEVDGYRFHRSRAAFQRDRDRDARLLAAGWRVLRLTHDEVMANLPRALDKIRAAVAAPPRPREDR